MTRRLTNAVAKAKREMKRYDFNAMYIEDVVLGTGYEYDLSSEEEIDILRNKVKAYAEKNNEIVPLEMLMSREELEKYGYYE